MRIRSSNWADDNAAPVATDRAERVGVAPAASAAQVDPSLVAAFDLELPYVVALRTVRSRIVQHYGADGEQQAFSCALIGLDCEEELAAFAANLSVVMARMQTPTLLIDGNLSQASMHPLFGLSERTEAQGTPIANLWIAGSGGATGQAALEQRPILERSYDWNLPVTQTLAVLSVQGAASAASIAAALAGFDQAILLLRKNVTGRRPARQLVDRLDERRIAITGTVLV
ncbi:MULTISPECIES: hypothetical protein [unclassified Sphingomonas]|uniref:hypothetical protein n=1 Tax=unclassified Sphingomonas TaxID=196159 RepID=UPI0006F2E9A9|nr:MULTISPECIES: hypothetical protein [unclassified Sphingomonas]KQM58873.1 hypothetical protein ASE65_11000 [Sphingomonas sp. Leaf16]KQN11128.1 hypothetical protein ASE81_11990 [Sphingomonas sp. Leaf29]KQN18427.1 hypothetical protein ASE83_11915 [Sphingomonas sp. Leaf32]